MPNHFLVGRLRLLHRELRFATACQLTGVRWRTRGPTELSGGGGGDENRLQNLKDEGRKIDYIILWLLGVPFGLLLLVFLLRGCT
jgi:hypothetical protein